MPPSRLLNPRYEYKSLLFCLQVMILVVTTGLFATAYAQLPFPLEEEEKTRQEYFNILPAPPALFYEPKFAEPEPSEDLLFESLENFETPILDAPGVADIVSASLTIHHTLPHDHPLLDLVFGAWVSLTSQFASVSPDYQRHDAFPFEAPEDTSIFILSPERNLNVSRACLTALHQILPKTARTSKSITASWWQNEMFAPEPGMVTLAIIAEPSGIIHRVHKSTTQPSVVSEGWPWHHWIQSKGWKRNDLDPLAAWEIGNQLFKRNHDPQPRQVAWASSWLRTHALGLMPLVQYHAVYDDLFLPIRIILPTASYEGLTENVKNRLTEYAGEGLSLELAHQMDQVIDRIQELALQSNHTVETFHPIALETLFSTNAPC